MGTFENYGRAPFFVQLAKERRYFELSRDERREYVASLGGLCINGAFAELNRTIDKVYNLCEGLPIPKDFRLSDVRSYYGVRGNRYDIYDALTSLSEVISDEHSLRAEGN